MGAPPSDNIHIGLRVTIQTTECEIITARGEGRKAFLSRCGGLMAMGTTALLLLGKTDSSIVTLRLKHG